MLEDVSCAGGGGGGGGGGWGGGAQFGRWGTIGPAVEAADPRQARRERRSTSAPVACKANGPKIAVALADTYLARDDPSVGQKCLEPNPVVRLTAVMHSGNGFIALQPWESALKSLIDLVCDHGNTEMAWPP